MAAAGRETLYAIRNLDLPQKSTAWSLIRIYYSAFFYAHVLMRMTGLSVSYFEQTEISKLRQVANAYNVPESNDLKRGNYKILYTNPGFPSLDFTRDEDLASHEGLWSAFKSRLEQVKVITDNSLLPENQKTRIKDELDLVIGGISQRGANGGNWLSRMRNSLNYKQSHGVWYPYNSSYTRQDIADLVDRALGAKDGMTSFDMLNPNEIKAFTNCCCAIIGMCKGSLMDLSVRSSGKRSFIRYSVDMLEESVRRSVNTG